MDDRSTMLGSMPEQLSINNIGIQKGTVMSPSTEDDDGSQSSESSHSKAIGVNETKVKESAKANAKSKGHPADIRRQMGGTSGKGSTKKTAISKVEWGANHVLHYNPEEDDDDANDKHLDDGSDSRDQNWPSFDGSIGDYFQDSSDEEDFC